MATLYKSLFGFDLEPAKYIAELMCSREAKRNGEELPIDYIKLDKWKRTYRSYIQQAYVVLKVYRPDAIIRAIRENKNVYSLRAKWFHDKIKIVEDDILAKESVIAESQKTKEEVKQLVVEEQRPVFKAEEKKTTIDRLRGL